MQLSDRRSNKRARKALRILTKLEDLLQADKQCITDIVSTYEFCKSRGIGMTGVRVECDTLPINGGSS